MSKRGELYEKEGTQKDVKQVLLALCLLQREFQIFNEHEKINSKLQNENFTHRVKNEEGKVVFNCERNLFGGQWHCEVKKKKKK